MTGETTERFWKNVRVGGPDECWLWTGGRQTNGYGKFYVDREVGQVLAHRWALEQHLGRPLLPGMESMHSCDTPACVRIEHLSEGTHRQNMAQSKERGRARGARYDQTHCIHGHELTVENTHLKPSRRTRSGYERCCRECNRAYLARRRASRKGLVSA